MTPERIIEIRKATHAADVTTPFADTLAFGQAVANEERRAALTEAAEACLNEKVDADDTKHESDYAYNKACDDCASAIRHLRP